MVENYKKFKHDPKQWSNIKPFQKKNTYDIYEINIESSTSSN